MTISKTAFIAGGALIVVIIAIIAAKSFGVSSETTLTSTPAVSDDGAHFDGIPDQRLVKSPPPRSLITGPGKCELSGGKIVFLSPTTARHDNATFAYENIDDPARLIYWRAEPNDGVLRVGPNIFSDLKLPKGSTTLTVTLNDQNHASRYTLTASASYGVWKDNAIIGTTTTECEGKITVEFN